MATAQTRREDLPFYAQDAVARVELMGFQGWKFLANSTLVERNKRLQVRDIAAHAPHNEVARYAAALKQGDLMPPVIMTRDGYLVDGNTRTEAARRAGWDHFPAIMLDVAYEGAPEAMIKQLTTLGAAFNLTHGRGMSRQNVERVILTVANPGDKAQEIARKLHIPVYTVQSALNITKARERAERLGVDVSDEKRLTGSHMALMGGRNNRYTDPVFAEFLSLVRDARYSLKDSKELGSRIEALGSETEKLALITAERDARHDVIRGTATKPSLAAKLRQSLGFTIANGDVPGNLVELGPVNTRMDHKRTLYDAVDILMKVITQQENLG
jgi:hypothetical protein